MANPTITYHKTTWIQHAFWLVKNLWVIVPVNSLKTATNYNRFIKAIDRIFYGFTGIINSLGIMGEHFKSLYLSRLRLVTYKLFSYSPNIPRAFITPISPQKMRSIAWKDCKIFKREKWVHTYLIDQSLLGLFRVNETNNWNKLNRLRIPTGRRQTSWLCTSTAEELNHGLPRTNPASGQSGTRTRDVQISNPTP